jgi:protein-disulfide isomerase
MKLNRRTLLLAATALTAAPALAQDAVVDLTKLNEAPANGENPQGSDTAKVTVIEYASVSCPHCAAFQKDVYPLLKKEYIDTGKIKFLFREFPHNDAALGGFMLARCAPKDKYLAITDVLLTTQDKWLPAPLEGLKNIAMQAGFTEETFNACLKNTDVAKGILAERDRANGFGITGIPYMFINGVKVDGEKTFEALKALIDPLLV